MSISESRETGLNTLRVPIRDYLRTSIEIGGMAVDRGRAVVGRALEFPQGLSEEEVQRRFLMRVFGVVGLASTGVAATLHGPVEQIFFLGVAAAATKWTLEEVHPNNPLSRVRTASLDFLDDIRYRF